MDVFAFAKFVAFAGDWLSLCSCFLASCPYSRLPLSRHGSSTFSFPCPLPVRLFTHPNGRSSFYFPCIFFVTSAIQASPPVLPEFRIFICTLLIRASLRASLTSSTLGFANSTVPLPFNLFMLLQARTRLATCCSWILQGLESLSSVYINYNSLGITGNY